MLLNYFYIYLYMQMFTYSLVAWDFFGDHIVLHAISCFRNLSGKFSHPRNLD